MARTARTATTSTSRGVKIPNAVAADVANGEQIPVTPQLRVVAKNTGAVARTVTFAFSVSNDGVAATNTAVSIPAGEEWIFGPFNPQVYGDTLKVDANNAEVTLRYVQ